LSDHPPLGGIYFIPNIMLIKNTVVSFTAQEAFDILYQTNQRIWEDAIDAINDRAQEIYIEHYGENEECDYPPPFGTEFILMMIKRRSISRPSRFLDSSRQLVARCCHIAALSWQHHFLRCFGKTH
jgi:hypothetical protein